MAPTPKPFEKVEIHFIAQLISPPPTCFRLWQVVSSVQMAGRYVFSEREQGLFQQALVSALKVHPAALKLTKVQSLASHSKTWLIQFLQVQTGDIGVTSAEQGVIVGFQLTVASGSEADQASSSLTSPDFTPSLSQALAARGISAQAR